MRAEGRKGRGGRGGGGGRVGQGRKPVKRKEKRRTEGLCERYKARERKRVRDGTNEGNALSSATS